MKTSRRVARNSQWEGLCAGGLEAEPPAVGVNGGLGAKHPAAGGWGSGGKVPSRRRHGGLEAEPPALENLAFFLQKYLNFRAILLKHNAFKT